MTIKRKVLERIGLYDEESFTPYGSDETDWHWRAVNIGYKVILNGESVVGHFEGHDAKQLPTKGYLLIHTNWLKAALYNNSLWLLLTRRLPKLLFMSIGSIKYLLLHKDPTRVILDLKSYWLNLKNIKTIIKERRKRMRIAKKLIREQKMVGESWW
jgi:GT2 family glycosyltransferase